MSTDEILRKVFQIAPQAANQVVSELPDAERERLLQRVLNAGLPAPNDDGILSADAIMATEWPEPTWAVPGLLPVGLTILAGRPKVGKSWLALQIAHAVAAGGHALGQRVEAGPVLYLALEDTPRRLQERMRRQSWPPGLPADFMPMGLFQEKIGDLSAGGGERLAERIYHKGYRLVVIDTLSRAAVGDPNSPEDMTLALEPAQLIAHQSNCAILVVDHHRKRTGEYADPISDILGSTAKGALLDTALGLYKERGRAGAKLRITGRDVEEKTLALRFDVETGCWQNEGDADALEITERRQEILDALEGLGSATLKELVEATGQNKGNVYQRLQDLASAGLVSRTGSGRGTRYVLRSRING